jgi:hypothetical protein
MKSITQTRPDIDAMKNITTAVHESAAKDNLSIIYVLEFYSLKKILQVPSSATAFQRSHGFTNVTIIKYPDNTPEGLEIARKVADRCIEFAASSNADGEVNTGYGNYSAYAWFARVHTS